MPTTANGLRYPTDNDPFDVALDLSNLAADVYARTVARFASTAARDAAIPEPGSNDAAWVSGVGLTVYSSGAWAVVLGSTGPLNLSPNPPFVIGTAGAKYEVINGMTYYSYDIRRTGSSWTSPINIFTFPAGARPTGIPHYNFVLRQNGATEATGNMTVATSGVVTLGMGGSANDHLYASGCFPSG